MKCPNCGGMVFAVDTLDSEWFNGNYYDAVEGTCPDCGKSYKWTEVYTFERCEDIEEIKENDHL